VPAVPWVEREKPGPERQYLAMASRLPLRSYLSVPGFLRDTMAIRRQLAGADGLVGYALFAELGRKTFWTFSVWRDQESLDSFARGEPHRTIIKRLSPLMGKTNFKSFPIDGSELPLTRERMKAPVR
jgi:quinol monooxygenase YgiN